MCETFDQDCNVYFKSVIFLCLHILRWSFIKDCSHKYFPLQDLEEELENYKDMLHGAEKESKQAKCKVVELEKQVRPRHVNTCEIHVNHNVSMEL